MQQSNITINYSLLVCQHPWKLSWMQFASTQLVSADLRLLTSLNAWRPTFKYCPVSLSHWSRPSNLLERNKQRHHRIKWMWNNHKNPECRQKIKADLTPALHQVKIWTEKHHADETLKSVLMTAAATTFRCLALKLLHCDQHYLPTWHSCMRRNLRTAQTASPEAWRPQS